MDQYRVVSPDGREYGPVDLPGLLQWVRDGRVLGNTLVRKGDGAPVIAESLPELAAAFAPPSAHPAPPIATTVPLPTEFRSWIFIGTAWELVKPHWLPLGLMFMLPTLVGLIPYLGACVSVIINGAIYVGIYRAIMGMLAGRPPTVGMLFNGFDRLGQAFLATLSVGILVAIGTLCCIVPGVILSIMWMFVYLVLAETELDFWEAMKASADLTKGYRWELFCLMLACFVVGILGFLACCVGIFVAQAVVFTTFALVYRFLQAKQAGRTV
jgi:uncharacterized membrane protein